MSNFSKFDPSFRVYFLPVGENCSENCRFCMRAGCKNENNRSLSDVLSIIKKAASAKYSQIEFSAGVLFRSDLREILHFCHEQRLFISIQIDWLDRSLKSLLPLKAPEISWNYLIESGDRVENAGNVLNNTFTLFPLCATKTIEFLSHHRNLWERIYFQFPPFSDQWPSISVREIHFLIEKIKKIYPEFVAQPPRGREVWDPRIDPSLGLEVELQPSFSSEISKGDKERPLEFSIIIPSFNSKLLLKNVVRHLLALDFDPLKFEFIIIDDGSSDGTLELIRNFLAPEKGIRNFSYYYFPRPKERRRGDGSFRAGIARNHGAKYTKGKILCFLDSDIITPKNYLLELSKLHESFDVVQNIRLHLKNRKGNELQLYEDVQAAKDTYILEERYWGTLFRTENWSSLPYFWKYTCTYSLSVSKDLFFRAGCFKKTFVFYGFEDTDFGYRLWKLGARFHLSKIVTYHLETSEDRTEYKKSNIERHLVLSKTAKVFFLNNLDSGIFLHFYSMMGGEKGFVYYWKKLWKRPMPR
jgi:glycosyltransferase involved in cell wall biosynthesis